MARPFRSGRTLVVALTLLAALALPGIARAQPGPGTEINQCRNRLGGASSAVNDCTGSAWVTGNAGQANSFYREGDFVPMRSLITNLQAGRTYSLRVGYDAVEGGLHAYDYLGSVDGSIHPGQQIAPCLNSPPTSGPHACGHAPSTLLVPVDTHTTFPPLLNGGQKPGHFSTWGGTLEGAAYHYCPGDCGPIGPVTPGTVERQIDVTFRAAGNTVVLAWGAHIASTLAWGPGRTFISAGSGSSFHMRLKQIQEQGGQPQSTGGQELSLSASALAPQPSPFTTSVAPPSINTDENVIDTATLRGVPNRPVTGEVQFFVCGPAAGGPPDCSEDGSPVGPPQVLETLAGVTSEATIKFPQEGAGPIDPGHYCFRAEYSPSPGSHYSPARHSGGPNQLAECFVVMLPPPRLTVTKLCDPLGDTGLFNLLVDGVPFGAATNVPCGHVEGPHEVSVGDHTVSESAGTGTDLGNYEPPVFGGNCAPSGLVTLALGDSKTCTITNVRIPQQSGFLAVEKICENGGSGSFEIHLDGMKVAELGCGDTTEPIELAPGDYTVTEAPGEDTSLADFEPPVFGGDCAGGSVTIVAGETAHCTITNTRIPPTTTLEVKKLCDPAGDDGQFKLTIDTVTGESVHQTVVGCGGTTDAVHVNPGTYVVGEKGANGTHVTEYDRFIGGACDSDGTVTVEAGDEAICTITNVRRDTEPKPALLTVTKICVPADDGGRFNLTINGQTARDVACGGSFGPVPVPPGQQQVGESAGTGTSLVDYTSTIGGACTADGTVTLAAGQQATCTITNERAGEETGTVEIEKQCSPAGTSGHFQVELDQHVFRISCGQSTGPVVIGVGDHRIGEVAASGNTDRFETTIGGDCAPSGSFTLSAGRHVRCIVTNTVVPLEPPVKPPPDCYTLTVRPRTAIAGKHARVVALVHVGRRPVQGIRVYARGPGVSAVRTTERNGRAVFRLRFQRRGILRVTIRQQYQCPKVPPRKVGVLGAATPPVTG